MSVFKGSRSEFRAYVLAEAEKGRGVYVPVRAGFFRRLFVRSAPVERLHPNPDDEFCSPEVGPGESILADYERKIRDAEAHAQKYRFDQPLMVQQVRPDGYMILNGHHRWAAAGRTGMKRVPICIVNLTQETDVRAMLSRSKHDRRVTLDLDEVVLAGPDEPAERQADRLFRRMLPYRLRLGVPALFHYLNKQGWDIWLYSAEYAPPDNIRALLQFYGARITGVLTGTGRNAALLKNLEGELTRHYPVTLHVDVRSVLRVDSRTRAYEEHALSGDPLRWSTEVMDVIGAMEKHE